MKFDCEVQEHQPKSADLNRPEPVTGKGNAQAASYSGTYIFGKKFRVP
jgi:hypothetical protein